MARPILIDPQDGPCEICAASPAPAFSAVAGRWLRKCQRCGTTIPRYENMNGSGFLAPMPHHYHLIYIEGKQGREGVYQELCLGCYETAFAKVYPHAELPVPPAVVDEAMPPDRALLTAPSGFTEHSSPDGNVGGETLATALNKINRAEATARRRGGAVE